MLERIDTSPETDDTKQDCKPPTAPAKKGKAKEVARKYDSRVRSRKMRLPLLKRKLEDSRIPTSDEDDDSAISSDLSPESARLQAARYAAGKQQPKVATRASRIPSSGSDATDSEWEETPMGRDGPVSSGVFDYISWVVSDRLSLVDRETLHGKCPIRVGSMCSGMGTEDIGLRAIERAMLTCGHVGFQMVSSFKAESDPRKVDFLYRHASRQTQIFRDNAALAAPMPVNMHGEPVARPKCNILVCGIVCVDISGLTSSPKPVSGCGMSGLALGGLLQSLTGMPFDDRPDMINLECVARLGQRRKVDPDNRTGTQYVTDQLGKLGYVGGWCKVRPRNFFLPQSRPRVYSIHLKRKDFSEASADARKKDMEKAFQILERMQTSAAEKLEAVLERVPVSEQPIGKSKRGMSGQTRSEAGGSNRKWPSAHDGYAEQHGLALEERHAPFDFVSEVGKLMSPRATDAMWLKLATCCKKTQCNWKQPLLVLPHSFSISYATIRQEIFPCVTPSHRYVVLRRGKAQLASGLTVLAVQGIQGKEVESFQLAKEDDALLRDLGGNAFTANIIAAFLIAGALVM